MLVGSLEGMSRRMGIECWWGLWRAPQACGERQQEDKSDADQETPRLPVPGAPVREPALLSGSDFQSGQCRGKARNGVLTAANAAQLARGRMSEAGVLSFGTAARMVVGEEAEGHPPSTHCSKEGGRLEVCRVWDRARSCSS